MLVSDLLNYPYYSHHNHKSIFNHHHPLPPATGGLLEFPIAPIELMRPRFDLIESQFGRIGPSQPDSSFKSIQKWSKSIFENTIVFLSTRRSLRIKHKHHSTSHAPSRATPLSVLEIYLRPTHQLLKTTSGTTHLWRQRQHRVKDYVITYVSKSVGKLHF